MNSRSINFGVIKPERIKNIYFQKKLKINYATSVPIKLEF